MASLQLVQPRKKTTMKKKKKKHSTFPLFLAKISIQQFASKYAQKNIRTTTHGPHRVGGTKHRALPPQPAQLTASLHRSSGVKANHRTAIGKSTTHKPNNHAAQRGKYVQTK